MSEKDHLPKVSVIIPTYNRAGFLREAIQSVLDQTFQDWELIVVDDGSTDSTREVVASFKDPRIRYIYQENRGVAGARNAGVQASRGAYIGFLDSDDMWLPEKLALQVRQLDDLPPSVGLVYSDLLVFSQEEGRDTGLYLRGRRPPQGKVRPDLLRIDGWFISPSTTLIRREVFQKVGLFDEHLKRVQDWELWVRIASSYEVEGLDMALARWRDHSSNIQKDVKESYQYGLSARLKVLATCPLTPMERKLLLVNIAHHHSYGIKMLRSNNRSQAWRAFLQSVRTWPFERKTYIHLGLPLISPVLYSTFLGLVRALRRREPTPAT